MHLRYHRLSATYCRFFGCSSLALWDERKVQGRLQRQHFVLINFSFVRLGFDRYLSVIGCPSMRSLSLGDWVSLNWCQCEEVLRDSFWWAVEASLHSITLVRPNQMKEVHQIVAGEAVIRCESAPSLPFSSVAVLILCRYVTEGNICGITVISWLST